MFIIGMTLNTYYPTPPFFHHQALMVESWQESKVEAIAKRCGGLGKPRDVFDGKLSSRQDLMSRFGRPTDKME